MTPSEIELAARRMLSVVGESFWSSDEIIGTYLGKDFVKEPWTDSIDLTEDIESIMQAWGIWDNIFTKPTTDGQDKVFDESGKVSDGSTSWEDL
jgi:hypothetical protein